MIKVGLIGYGKAGQAVAQVLQRDPRLNSIERRPGHPIQLGNDFAGFGPMIPA